MSQRVLVVDDEVHILRAAEFKLKRCGYDVQCASDGEQAWEQMQQQVPDVLVTDVQMPRLNGIQLIERLKQHAELADLSVILLTAKGFELDPKEIRRRHNLFDILTKPFSPRELCQRVQAALDESQRQLEVRG